MTADVDRAIVLRPIDPADAASLDLFHEHLSREAARLRFFTVHPHLAPREIEHFTNVDHERREAIVAWCGEEIVGVGRFEQADDPQVAEVAFVIADAWQGHGVGSQLLDALIAHARSRGVTRLVAETLPENERMRRLFHHSGHPVTSRWDAGVLHMTLDLQA